MRGRAGGETLVLYARAMTPGDASGSKAASRPASKPAPGEPKVTASKAGTPGKRSGRGSGTRSESDVLERLSRLDTAPPPGAGEADPVTLPPIVEADPSFPAIDRASTKVLEAVAEPARGVAAPSSRIDPPLDVIPDVRFATSLDEPTALAPAPVREPFPTVMPVPDVVPLPATVAAPVAQPAPQPAPAPAPEPAVERSTVTTTTVRRGKPRVRRVTRVVRHVDTWSVFKVALVFNTILYVVCLTAGVLLWNVAYATGTVDNVEKFFEQFGWESFQFHGGELYHNAWIAGLFVAVGLTGFAVLLATLFNLITDLVGGIRVSVLEEEVVARGPARESDHTVTTVPQSPVKPG
jgi:hypothetical protein